MYNKTVLSPNFQSFGILTPTLTLSDSGSCSINGSGSFEPLPPLISNISSVLITEKPSFSLEERLCITKKTDCYSNEKRINKRSVFRRKQRRKNVQFVKYGKY